MHANEQSDVDILVELNEPTFDHYMELKFRLEEILGRDVDLVLKDTLKDRLKPIIEKFDACLHLLNKAADKDLG